MAKGVQIEENNPYVTGFVIKYPEGDSSLERQKLNYQASSSDKLHLVTNYDNLSDLAYDFYGSSKWWWVIADANKIFDPLNITPNTSLVIPDLDKIRAILP